MRKILYILIVLGVYAGFSILLLKPSYKAIKSLNNEDYLIQELQKEANTRY